MITPRIRIAILGAIGHGPCDMTDLRWALNKAGIPFLETTTVLNAMLPIMEAEQRIERGTEGKGTYWRLPAATPMASPAAVAVPVREGFISAADFRASGRRK